MKTDRPIFAYAMLPNGKSSFKDFYDGGKLRELLENPGQIRPSGWDLMTYDRAKMVKGEYLEVKAGDRKLIRLYEDGTLLARVPGDQEFMSWGQSDENFNKMPRLNPLALIEFTLNFVLLASRVAPRLTPAPDAVTLTVELRNAFFGDKRILFLPAYGVSSMAWYVGGPAYPAQETRMIREHKVPIAKLVDLPYVVAFELVQKIYSWFGLPTEEIPYITKENETRFVDPNLIIHSRAL